LKKHRRDLGAQTISDTLKLFTDKDKKKLFAIVVINTSLAILDLIGVIAIGLLGTLTLSGVSSTTPSSSITSILDILHLGDLEFQIQIALLGLTATASLLTRTGLSYFFTRRMLHFLSKRSAQVTSQVVESFFQQDLIKISNKPLPELTYELTDGVKALTMGIIGSAIIIVSDFTLLLILSISLIVVDAITAIVVLMIFSLIGLYIYHRYRNIAIVLSAENSKYVIESNELIANMIHNFKELYSRNQISYTSGEIGKLRTKASNSFAELAFIPNVSKYVIEASLVLGALIISGIQFYATDAKTAIAKLTVFLAAGSRIAPALLRVQQNSILMRSSMGYARPVLNLIETLRLEGSEIEESSTGNTPLQREGSAIKYISFENVSFSYEFNESYEIADLDFDIKEGEFIGIVGPSGSGKSTLLDLMLGLVSPTVGCVTFLGQEPKVAISNTPNLISYVPQDAQLITGSIRSNLHLGVAPQTYSDEEMKNALIAAGMSDFLEKITGGIDGNLGVQGVQLSGGEGQRIALARAILSKPRVLILDEAMSALDHRTEIEISNNLTKMKHRLTIILVTHRTSSLKNCDRVLVMDMGRLIEQGSYQELRLTSRFLDDSKHELKRI
jgi:ABC-type multidrug transport system fused ATPase/permease subunit